MSSSPPHGPPPRTALGIAPWQDARVRREVLIARNPEQGSSLPVLLRVPVPGGDLLLKECETWPRTSKVYCQRMSAWPGDAEVVDALSRGRRRRERR
jgi:hypothetical protein